VAVCVFVATGVNAEEAKPGIWGSIVRIQDGAYSPQASMTGFGVINYSPYVLEYLGSNNSNVHFADIPVGYDFNDLANSKDIVQNIFSNNFDFTQNADNTAAFFRMCPASYGKCLYFKLVSEKQSYGYYYTSDAPAKHQLDLDKFFKHEAAENMLKSFGISAAFSALSIGLGHINNMRILQRDRRMASQVESLAHYTNHYADEISDLSIKLDDSYQTMENIASTMDKKASALEELVKMEKKQMEYYTRYRHIELDIENFPAYYEKNEIQKMKSESKRLRENEKQVKDEIIKKKTMITNLEDKITSLNLEANNLAIKQPAHWIEKEKVLREYKKINNILTDRLNKTRIDQQKRGFFNKVFNTQIGSSIATMVVIPVALTYIGLLEGTRGSHQGLWSTDFMAFTIKSISQEDMNRYPFLKDADLSTKIMESPSNNTGGQKLILSFAGDGLDNQPLVELSLFVLSNVWNPRLTKSVSNDNWGVDRYRGELTNRDMGGDDEVAFEESAALGLSISSYNDLDFTYLFNSEKETRNALQIGSSDMSIFAAPELYSGTLDQQALKKINMQQDKRTTEESQAANQMQLESLWLKNDEYSKIYVNPDLNDNGIEFTSTKLHGELVDEDSDYDIDVLITRNKREFEKYQQSNAEKQKDQKKLVVAYLDTDCYKISDSQSCLLNIAITGIDHPLVGALYIADSFSKKVRIPVFINTDMSVKTLVIPFDKTFNVGEAFNVVLENFSDHKVDDLNLRLPEGLRIDANASTCLVEGGVARGLCEFVVYGAEHLAPGDHPIDVLIDHSKFKTIVLQVEEESDKVWN
jgi:hypothetical protein